MMTPIKILIPTDFSVQADYAFLMVQRLSERAAMEIHFLHVLHVPDTVTMDPQGQIATCGEIDVQYVKTQRDIALRKLQQLRTQHGEQVQTHLLLGKVTNQIADFAQQHHYDLIVMGTKGASGLKERLSGSETQMVARHSRVPLLSLMCDRSQLAMRHLLLVHDFNDLQQLQLPVLHRLIAAFDLQVHFLQIVQHADQEVLVRKQMQVFAEANALTHASFHVLLDKHVEAGVSHFPQLQEMDILCIGTHGKGGLFHQSITEKLINHLAKPLISFHLN